MKAATRPPALLRRALVSISRPRHNKSLRLYCLLIPIAVFAFTETSSAIAQQNYAIWGEIKIDAAADSQAPSAVNVILVKIGTGEVGRQSISSRGRYRFTNLAAAEYEIVIEANEREITRARLQIFPASPSPFYGFRQDFEFAWKNPPAARAGVISVADAYTRSPASQALFHKAEDAVANKKYELATETLQEIVKNDKADFQVWNLLGTVYLVQEKAPEAEKSYQSAIEAKPTFTRALINLGRLRSSQKRFEEAIEPLTRALEHEPQSAEANLLLGEAYLQVRKGSKAIGYLNEAAKLGKPEAHLRLGWLYNAAGMKDKAAIEYNEFLKKTPDYPDRKKLEEYISANKRT